jgi:hypothetical protein
MEFEASPRQKHEMLPEKTAKNKKRTGVYLKWWSTCPGK